MSELDLLIAILPIPLGLIAALLAASALIQLRPSSPIKIREVARQ